jgi:predicted transcriptional regulator
MKNNEICFSNELIGSLTCKELGLYLVIIDSINNSEKIDVESLIKKTKEGKSFLNKTISGLEKKGVFKRVQKKIGGLFCGSYLEFPNGTTYGHDVLDKISKNNGYVYLFHDSTRDLLKIGFSTNVEKRLKNIKSQFNSNITHISHYDGGIIEENRLQSKFSHLKYHNEWFHYNEDIISEFKNKTI